MVWVLVVLVYVAPNGAVNWDGPWRHEISKAMDKTFTTEADCRNAAITFIAKMHEGMLAPMRYRCMAVEAGLPRGAPR